MRTAVLLVLVACQGGSAEVDAPPAIDAADSASASLPEGESPYIFGMAGLGGESFMALADKRGWITYLVKLRPPIDAEGGPDYRPWSDVGFGAIVRVNYGYDPDGTLPCSAEYAQFASMVASWVASSHGAHIWIIGNEPNVDTEWPTCGAAREEITPERYAQAFLLARAAIHGVAGHATDQVAVAGISPWGDATTTGLAYFAQVMTLIGPGNADALILHAYTRDGLTASITSDELESTGLHHHFRIYRDNLAAVPAWAASLPVYITEANPLPAGWQGADTNWVQAMYQEVALWNSDATNQKIRAATIYRWPAYDTLYGIANFPLVQSDFSQALTHDYRWTTLPAH